MSRACLVEAYIAALPLAVVAIVTGADGRCRIRTGEPEPGETIHRQLYFKPSHADVVLSSVELDGQPGEAPAALVARLEQTAAMLGARHHALGDLRKVAEAAVDQVTQRVDAGRQNGDLKQLNRQYKLYRQAQIAKAEKAMPYSTFIERFTASLLREVATTGRAAG